VPGSVWQLGPREATAPKCGHNAERSSAAHATPTVTQKWGARTSSLGGTATHNHPIGLFIGPEATLPGAEYVM
jgi:hypothetical protein